MRPILLAVFAAAIYCSAMATRDAVLSVEIRDSAGKPTPVRVRLLDSAGKPPRAAAGRTAPDSPIPVPSSAIAVQYGRNDAAEGYQLQPDGSFYVDGSFSLSLPAGKYSLSLAKGYEYAAQNASLDVAAGKKLARTFRMERWIDMPGRGWFSADDHIHLRRSLRENPMILRWIAAEDVHVGNILQMGDFWTYFYSQYAFGKEGRYAEGDYLLSPGQEEPRTPEIGHTISLGAAQFVRFQQDYYSYGRVFDRVHELGGVSGFAHQGVSFHGDRGMTMNILSGKVDFLELLQFCVAGGPLLTENYYRFLDLGYKLTALAGSDFPWCGRGPQFGVERGSTQIGDARFYTLVGKQFDFDAWMNAVKGGRTFVTSGPMLELTVNDQPPGSTVNVSRGARVRIAAKAWGRPGQIPLRELEIIGHGESLKKISGESAATLETELELPVDHGIWIAARAAGGPSQAAHTTPVYVTVDGGGWTNPKTFARRLAECEQSLAELQRELQQPGERLDNQAQRHRTALERQIAATREILAKRKAAGE